MKNRYCIYDSDMANWLIENGCKVIAINFKDRYVCFMVSKKFKEATQYYKENIRNK